MRRLAGILIVSVICFSATASPLQQPDKRTEQLQKERDRLVREKDPVGHTKIQITISDILLSFAGEAVKSGDLAEMQKQLNEYVAAIQDAYQTMMNTGRDANRRPGGFKDLEIALRRQIIRIDDYAQALTYEQRQPLSRAKAEAAEIRDRLIKVLLVEDKNAKAVTP
jgi:hypothetical protein